MACRLADVADHRAALRGAWSDWAGQRRWQGMLEMPSPGRALMLVEAGAAACYAKTGALPAGVTEVDLLLHGPAPDGLVQVMLRAGRVSCTAVRVPAAAAAALAIPPDTALRAGWLEPWAAAPGVAIGWLALAAGDIDSRRNGIWAVKPRHLAGLPPRWVAALSAGRGGWLVS